MHSTPLHGRFACSREATGLSRESTEVDELAAFEAAPNKTYSYMHRTRRRARQRRARSEIPHPARLPYRDIPAIRLPLACAMPATAHNIPPTPPPIPALGRDRIGIVRRSGTESRRCIGEHVARSRDTRTEIPAWEELNGRHASAGLFPRCPRAAMAGVTLSAW